MTRAFEKGTELYAYEVMMTTIPNFSPRGSGKHNYKKIKDKEAGQCKYCITKNKKKCSQTPCPYLFERAVLGSLNYEQFVKEEYKTVRTPNFKSRIDHLAQNCNGNMFLNNEHGYRFYLAYLKLKNQIYVEKPYILAAIYMLTASSHLWETVESHVIPHKINFDQVNLRCVNLDEYAYYQMARMLYDSVPRIKFGEMADEDLITDDVFKLFVHGMLVQVHGAEVLSLFMGG
ncbi:MAG: hypothetical protein R3Y09_04395 [Clostridia bacterium]